MVFLINPKEVRLFIICANIPTKKKKRKRKGKREKKVKERKWNKVKEEHTHLFLQTFNYTLTYFHGLYKIQEIYNEKNINTIPLFVSFIFKVGSWALTEQ